MILVENLIYEEALKIKKEILKAYKDFSKKDKDLKNFGILNITSLFRDFDDFIKQENIIINLYYKFNFNRKIARTEISSNKEISITLTGKNKEEAISSLLHEIMHVIDFLKSKLHVVGVRKYYKKILEKDTEKEYNQDKDFVVPYLVNPYEFNVFINKTINKYKKDRKFRKNFNDIKTYKQLLTLMLSDKDIEITPHLVNDKSLKKRILSRLTRENIQPFKNEISFADKIKSFFN